MEKKKLVDERRSIDEIQHPITMNTDNRWAIVVTGLHHKGIHIGIMMCMLRTDHLVEVLLDDIDQCHIIETSNETWETSDRYHTYHNTQGYDNDMLQKQEIQQWKRGITRDAYQHVDTRENSRVTDRYDTQRYDENDRHNTDDFNYRYERREDRHARRYDNDPYATIPWRRRSPLPRDYERHRSGESHRSFYSDSESNVSVHRHRHRKIQSGINAKPSTGVRVELAL